MRTTITKSIAVLAFGVASLTMSMGAGAEEWPFVGGDYWEVTGIDIQDGGGWKYANWLADEWRKDLDFAKSKGWIKSYMVLQNVHGRSDEPDLYLITVVNDVPSGAVNEKRTKEYLDWQEKSIETLSGESGNRATYRTVMSTSLVQVMHFRN